MNPVPGFLMPIMGAFGPLVSPRKFFTPKQYALRASRRRMAKASRKRNR